MKTPKNSGKIWTADDIKYLRQLAKENTPTRLIAMKLYRSVEAIYSKARSIGLSLRPNNRPPYGTPKKKVTRKQISGFTGQDTEQTAEEVKKIYSSEGVSDDVTVEDVIEAEPTGDEFPKSIDDDTLTGTAGETEVGAPDEDGGL